MTNKVFEKLLDIYLKDYKGELDFCQHDSPYHLEGSVHTHIMMVSSHANYWYESILALLHDLGKPESKYFDPKTNKTHFQGHAGISLFKAWELIRKAGFQIDKEFKDIEEWLLYAINYHSIFYEKSNKWFDKYMNGDDDTFVLYKDLINFHEIDKLGSITNEKYDEVYNMKFKEKEFIPQEEHLPNIDILIGVPGSDKTTYIKKECENKVIISRHDTLVQYCKEKYNNDNYNECWNLLTKEEHLEIDYLAMKKFHDSVENNEDIVIDMTNVTIKTRKKWIVPNYNINMNIFIDDYSKLLKRNVENRKDKKISIDVLHFFMKRFELPLRTECDRLEINWITQ